MNAMNEVACPRQALLPMSSLVKAEPIFGKNSNAAELHPELQGSDVAKLSNSRKETNEVLQKKKKKKKDNQRLPTKHPSSKTATKHLSLSKTKETIVPDEAPSSMSLVPLKRSITSSSTGLKRNNVKNHKASTTREDTKLRKKKSSKTNKEQSEKKRPASKRPLKKKRSASSSLAKIQETMIPDEALSAPVLVTLQRIVTSNTKKKSSKTNNEKIEEKVSSSKRALTKKKKKLLSTSSSIAKTQLSSLASVAPKSLQSIRSQPLAETKENAKRLKKHTLQNQPSSKSIETQLSDASNGKEVEGHIKPSSPSSLRNSSSGSTMSKKNSSPLSTMNGKDFNDSNNAGDQNYVAIPKKKKILVDEPMKTRFNRQVRPVSSMEETIDSSVGHKNSNSNHNKKTTAMSMPANPRKPKRPKISTSMESATDRSTCGMEVAKNNIYAVIPKKKKSFRAESTKPQYAHLARRISSIEEKNDSNHDKEATAMLTPANPRYIKRESASFISPNDCTYDEHNEVKDVSNEDKTPVKCDLKVKTRRKKPKTPLEIYPNGRYPDVDYEKLTKLVKNPKYKEDFNKDVKTDNGPIKDKNWNIRFREYLAYYRKHNDHSFKDVNRKKSNLLYIWAQHQRNLWVMKMLHPNRFKRFASIDFVWCNPKERTWNDSYELLVAFQKKYGHADVPKRWKEDPHLGFWCRTNRTIYNYERYLLKPDQIDLLESIGFKWDVNGRSWRKKYDELKFFKKKHGHFRVPLDDPNGLALWMRLRRGEYARGTIPEENEHMLNFIGFDWNIDEKQATRPELKDSQQRRRPCSVSRDYTRKSPIQPVAELVTEPGVSSGEVRVRLTRKIRRTQGLRARPAGVAK